MKRRWAPLDVLKSVTTNLLFYLCRSNICLYYLDLNESLLLIIGRTVLVIAHRLSTIRNADLIAVLADGQIREVSYNYFVHRSFL